MMRLQPKLQDPRSSSSALPVASDKSPVAIDRYPMRWSPVISRPLSDPGALSPHVLMPVPGPIPCRPNISWPGRGFFDDTRRRRCDCNLGAIISRTRSRVDNAPAQKNCQYGTDDDGPPSTGWATQSRSHKITSLTSGTTLTNLCPGQFRTTKAANPPRVNPI
jgi:hypothetical protein